MRNRLAVVLLASALAGGCTDVLGVEDRSYAGPAGSGGGGGAGGCDNTDDDPQNCGACGHDCLGGECVDGACQPVLITALPNPDDDGELIVEPGPDGRIVWARYRRPGIIYSATKTPFSNVQLVHALDDFGWARGVALAEDSIYYSNYSDSDELPSRGIHVVEMDGSGATQLAGDSLLGAAWVHLYGEHVYFTTYFDTIAVGRVPRAGGPVEALVEFAGPEPHYEGLFLCLAHGSWVYYGSNAGVSRVRTDGSAQALLYPGGASDVIAVHAGELYWRTNGTLMRGSLDGTEPAQIVAPATGHIALREADAFFYLTRDNAVLRVPADAVDAEPEVVVFATLPARVAFDEVSLFYYEHKAGLHRLAF
jgi:hypothetical protein